MVMGVNKDEVLSMASNDLLYGRLSSWKANLLSIGGRLTLIKSVLGSLGGLNIGKTLKLSKLALPPKMRRWSWRSKFAGMANLYAKLIRLASSSVLRNGSSFPSFSRDCLGFHQIHSRSNEDDKEDVDENENLGLRRKTGSLKKVKVDSEDVRVGRDASKKEAKAGYGFISKADPEAMEDPFGRGGGFVPEAEPSGIIELWEM
ncbi:hypothetical protein Tco_0444735 [Tanacetum coccineum]